MLIDEAGLTPSGITKGIILAGGAGSRLYPATRAACKQLLPVYDKPLVYYPLSTLMLMGIRDILIISTPADLTRFRDLFGDGHQLGLRFTYAEQPKPEGIAQALIIGEQFIDCNPVALILGDNIFHGTFDFHAIASGFQKGAVIFGCSVPDPGRFGVLGFDRNGNVLSIEEKPDQPKSSYAVTGLYLYDGQAVDIAKALKPSNRNELEITDVNRTYLDRGQLSVVRFEHGMVWLDTGTHESMLEAGNFIATIEKRQGRKIACIEEIAYRMRYIERSQFEKLVSEMTNNSYKTYLDGVLREADDRSS
ncbi:MAG: glucose-1-phosphate thymidylyltransferase RfbA [Candidatus Zixiibacteriota bacterium]